jgi:hypothetical protein
MPEARNRVMMQRDVISGGVAVTTKCERVRLCFHWFNRYFRQVGSIGIFAKYFAN